MTTPGSRGRGIYVRTPEIRERVSRSLKSVNSSEDARNKKSEIMKALYRDGKTHSHSAQTNSKRSQTLKKFHERLTEEEKLEAKRKNAEGLRRAWEEGKFSNRRPAVHRRQSLEELSLKPYLESQGYEHNTWFFINHNGKTRLPDYVDRSGKRVVEYFGSFWHPQEHEEEYIQWYREAGWECTVIWDRSLESLRDALGKDLQ